MNNLIQHVTRTIYGAYLQTCRVLQRPMDIKEYTTINEAIKDPIKVPYQPPVATLGLQETESFDDINDSNKIGINYIVIGNGGHSASIDSVTNVAYWDRNIHESTDSAPFKMIPFVCRPIAADLPDTERANYRLRKVLKIDGELYVAYYAKLLNFTNSEVTMTMSHTINGKTTYVPFNPTISNLRAQPVQPGVENDGTMTFATAKAVFNFTEKDANYLIEAAINMFGSANEAIISEMAFCSGVDKKIVRSYPTSGNQMSDAAISNRNLYEAQAVQVVCFANTYYQANFGMLGFEVPFDIGAIEPLFGKQSM